MFGLGVGPDHPRLAHGVGFAVGVVGVFADLALVEVVENRDFGVTTEELFVSTKCLSRGTQPCTDALSKVDLCFNVLVADQVDEHLVRLLPDAVDTASALDEADDRPRQIVVDDDVGVL